MTWIKTVGYAEARGRLLKLYDRVKGPNDNVDNIMMAHGLRPHTLEGHMTLYKYVLHHPHNTVPKWLLEAIGVLVSMVNQCDYCVEHHHAGVARLLGDDERARAIRAALESGAYDDVFDKRQAAAFEYARKLTAHARHVTQDDITALREAGWDDGEILELNQVVAYFAYANRTVLGLGINTTGDILGLSPGDSSDANNWQHR